MLCDICHTREAKVIYTEIINGRRREQHLCENCAREQTLSLTEKLGNEIPIGTILSGILQNYAKNISAKSANEPVCMRCGMTASELVKGGRLGCPDCYNAFSMILDKNLRTVQGAVEHTGKVPVNAEKIIIKEPINMAKTPDEVMRTATDEIASRNSAFGEKLRRRRILRDYDEAVAEDIDALKKQLELAIKEEDFDQAAKLRDRIRNLSGEPAKKPDEAEPKRPNKTAKKTPATTGAKRRETTGAKRREEAEAKRRATTEAERRAKAAADTPAKTEAKRREEAEAKRRTKAETDAPANKPVKRTRKPKGASDEQ